MTEISSAVKTSIVSKNPKNRPGAELSEYMFGKIPPQARELEEAVLGAMMLDKDAVTTVVDILKAEAFYVEAHQYIFAAIHKLFSESESIDLLTVSEELKKLGKLDQVGGIHTLSELTGRVGSAAHVEHHARIISQKYIQRELIRISNETIRDSFDDTIDVFDLLDNSEANLFQIAEQNLRRGVKSMDVLIKETNKELDEIASKDGEQPGVPSGYMALDRITNGWQNSDLIILAARPAMGKTSFVLSVARNAAVDHKRPVAIFSLEMSDKQLAKRLISAEARVDNKKLRTAQLEKHEWAALHQAQGKLSEAPIFIDDTPAINIFELRAKCRRLKMKHDIQLVVIDYLQLMSAAGGSNKIGNREQEISSISRALKSIAKELDIPVIALSQLSRAVETRGGNKKPMLSDLRESGAIEQDADIVTFLYRPEYYGITEDEDNRDVRGMAEVIIAKHRNGEVGSVWLRFVNQFARFEDFDDSFYGSQVEQGEEGNYVTFGSRMNQEDSMTPPPGSPPPAKDDDEVWAEYE